MTESLQIAIIDDHPLFREGVVHTLGAQPDIEVVGEGESAADALRIVGEGGLEVTGLAQSHNVHP